LFSTTAIVHFINDSNNKWLHRNKDNWIPIDRKLNYIQNKSGSFEAAKDIRLYNMLPWFQKLFRLFLDERNIWRKKSERRGLLIDFAATGMGLARDGAVYAMLLWQAANRNISVADFVLYFALAAQYSNWLAGIASSYSQLQSTSLGLCDLRAFLDIENRFNRDKGFPLPGRAPEIVLDNVSFKYPGSSAETIKNINLTIKPGEKIALVGLNGAGKTTLVKLLSGLYAPTDGAIFVAGREMSGYNIDDYYSMFSAVFQEIILMPVSIAKNVALCEEKHIDRGKLLEALKLAGIYGKVMSLPDKENTLLLKNIHETAVELSGGEKQKIALARAIYKNGIIMVLDEPTAALDPVAESMMYQSYNELIKNATSIFISHRLSSTRFCDRILLLEDGRIAEQGSHDQLMAEGGKYASLFSVQSRYYTRVRLGIPTAICGRTEETSITDSR
jgi:ABC-type multidrug transport system fused ATPase/permease subunit